MKSKPDYKQLLKEETNPLPIDNASLFARASPRVLPQHAGHQFRNVLLFAEQEFCLFLIIVWVSIPVL